MEKYKVVKIENDGFKHWLMLMGVNQYAKNKIYTTIDNDAGFFRPGDILKRYVGFNGNIVAETYKLGQYLFVDLNDNFPRSKYELEHFYADLDFCDRIRLQWDVAQSLKSRGVKPSMSPQKNLHMLAFGPDAQVKVR